MRLRRGAYRLANVASPATILVAGVNGGGNFDGFNNNGLLSGTWGTLSNTAAPGGEVISSLHWWAGDGATEITIAGSGKTAWFSGRTITINGVQYTCTGALSVGNDTYAYVSASQLFVNGNSYTIAFP